ncbi:MAG: hypothetical protein J7621_05850 [Niastella sp.]|nr:hypothetical protein [Niastella sp.]
MKRKLTILTVLFLAATTFVQAQVGIGTTTPAASSALDVTSTTRGVLIPRMSSAQRTAITSPAEGLMVYQLNAPVGLWMFISGAWVRLTTVTDGFGPSTAAASNTSGAIIAVVLGGTDIPLPDAHNLGTNITINGSNTVFTVGTAGRYRITYGLNTTAAVLASSRVLVNGAPVTALTVAPVAAVTRMSADAIVTLAAGSTVNLQLFGLLGAVTLLNGSQGAGIVIQRVE